VSTLITKADGSQEYFKVEKLRRSLRRAGARPSEINEIIAEINPKLHDGIKTEIIYREAFELLRNSSGTSAARYSLRRALFNLQGKCAEHEIDIAAYKTDHSFIAEAKFHARPGIKSDLQVAMYSYARFLDLKSLKICDQDICGIKEFWIITNTKFTSSARDYANCVGLPLLSWEYPKRNNLHDRIQRAAVYPITVLHALSPNQTKTLIARDVILCSDIVKNPSVLRHLHLSTRKHEAIVNEAREICGT